MSRVKTLVEPPHLLRPWIDTQFGALADDLNRQVENWWTEYLVRRSLSSIRIMRGGLNHWIRHRQCRNADASLITETAAIEFQNSVSGDATLSRVRSCSWSIRTLLRDVFGIESAGVCPGRQRARLKHRGPQRATRLPLTAARIMSIVERCSEHSISDVRNAVLLLLMYDVGIRPAQVLGSRGTRSRDRRVLQIEDLERRSDGEMFIVVRQAKGQIRLRLADITAHWIRRWLQHLPKLSGPLLRGFAGDAIGSGATPLSPLQALGILKALALNAGLDARRIDLDSPRYGLLADLLSEGAGLDEALMRCQVDRKGVYDLLSARWAEVRSEGVRLARPAATRCLIPVQLSLL